MIDSIAVPSPVNMVGKVVDHATSAPSTPYEIYALMGVGLILGIVGLFLWFQAKMMLAKARESGALPELERRKTRWDAPTPPQDACTACPDLRHLESSLGAKMDMMMTEFKLRFQALESKVDRTEERQEARLEALDSKMDTGFRTLHDRLDKHIEASQPPRG